jgi:dTDP-4-amino-4,6-dideoxygalactose transaminase
VVPVVDLSRRGAQLAPRFAEIAGRIAASGQILLGPETGAFEDELAAWAGAGAVAVSSGASAIQLALAALGVAAGDEVIVPAFTAVPTAAAVAALGAVPVFVDVEPDTATLDASLVDEAITARTRAVVVVHLYGRPATLPSTSLPIVEDAAQSMGAVSDHTRSAATTYSFYPTKNLGGIGDGGAVVSTRTDLLDAVRRRRTHGMTEQYVHVDVSQNFRMSELEAAWLRLGLADLAAGNERRRAIAEHYRTAAPHLAWQAPHPDHVYHLCVFRAADRDVERAALATAGVGTSVQYPLALTQQPAYRHLTRRPCPNAEAWAASCISVPCFPELTDAEVEHVAGALASLPAPHQVSA